MEQQKFWTTPKKIILTILLAVLWFQIFSCSARQADPLPSTMPSDSDATVPMAFSIYTEYNQQYFQDRLPHDIEIKTTDTPHTMAETGCNDEGQDCSIAINLKYVAAPRELRSALVHEMCHIKEWKKTLLSDKPENMDKDEWDHGRAWRACMLEADLHGVFREINIDYYHEGQ